MKDYRQLSAFLRLYASKTTERTKQVMRETQLRIVKDAKQNLVRHDNIDTGALYESIRDDFESDPHGFTYKIIADAKSAQGVEYAEFIEFGTGIYNNHGDGRKTPWRYKGKMRTWTDPKTGKKVQSDWYTTVGYKSHPFIRPAFRRNMGYLTKQMRQAIRVDGGAL